MLTAYEVALFGHVLGVLLFVSGIVLAGVPFELARRREDPAEIAVILAVARAGVPLVGLGSLTLLGFGLWLVDAGGFTFASGWVVGALALFGAALALGAIGGRRPRHARLQAARLAAAKAPIDAELRALLDDPLSRAINYAAGLVVLAILVLMVFKP